MVVNKRGKIFMVTSKEDENNNFTCNEVFLSKLQSDYIGIPLPWSVVGVHKYEGVDVTETSINRSEIVGKAMKCGQVICSWMPEWVMSKIDY